MSNNLLQRIAFAAIAIPVAVGAVWVGGWTLATLLALLGVLGSHEVYDLARMQGIDALDGWGLAAAAAMPVAAFWAKGSEQRWAEPALFAGALWILAVLVAAMVARGPKGHPLAAVAVTVFGSLYASALPAFLIAIRHGAHSAAQPHVAAWLVILPLVLTWICDTCAMAAGSTLGGPKLAPVLSPQKTWAGAVGGTAGALVASVVYGELILRPAGLQLSMGQLLAVGLVVAVVGQVGDVAESLFKREAGVKDSSSLIPGHGGVLDRLDSLYFVLPTTAGLFKLYGIV